MADLTAKLASIRILYRGADTLPLWGIPYDMSPGQSPIDIDRGYYDDLHAWYSTPAALRHIFPENPKKGWISLGFPGWWATIPRDEQEQITAWLAPLRARGAVPDDPYSWNYIDERFERPFCDSPEA